MFDFVDLFVRTPGDFFYHITVILALSAGLAIAFGQRAKHPQSRTATVYGAAISGVLIGWLFILAGALVAIYTSQDAGALLPPLERVVNTWYLILIGWAFLTVDQPRRGNAALLVMLALIALTTVGYVLTGIQWTGIAATADFNLSQYGVVWAFAQTGFALVGLVLTVIFFRSVFDAPIKFVFFAVLTLGYGGTLWRMANGQIIGDYSGLSRLALFMTAPIIPYVVYRKVIYGYDLALEMLSKPAQTPPSGKTVAQENRSIVSQPLSNATAGPESSPVERESVQLLRALGLILEETEPAEIPARIVRASVEILKADVGALLSIEDANYADILVAYDHARGRPIPAMLSLNLEEQITLVNAIERKQQRPLYMDRNLNELEDLYSRLDISQVGPAYFQPLMRDNELIAILVVALPYAKRELRDAERELLKGVGIISGSLLALSYAANEATVRAEERVIQAMITGVPLDEITESSTLEARQETEAALEAVKYQNEALQKQVTKLKLRLDDERTRLTNLLGDTEPGLSVTQRIVAINEEQEQLRQERDELAHRLQEAETALASATGTDEDAVFNTQIETLNREKRELQAEMESLRAQLEELEGMGAEPLPAAAEDVLERMSSENQRLLADRDQLNLRLEDVQEQLQALGIDSSTVGLTQLIQQLYEQKSKLQSRADALKLERDALLNERRRFEQRIRKEDERETQIETMESEIRHLATDREAITRQRNALRQERNDLSAKLDKIKEQRARLLADLSVYEDDLQQVQSQLSQLQGELTASRSEQDLTRAEYLAVRNERDQLIARLEGNRDRVQELSDNAQLELRTMIQEITTQRNQLLEELSEVRAAVQTETPPPAVNEPPAPSTNPQLLMSMVDSLRTPMTAIVSYIDVLVGESAGLLNDMQRQFVRRISANVVSLETMLNDLSHITALDTGLYQLRLEEIHVVNMIEDAITDATYQFREKDLTLQLKLDDNIPEFYADASGLHQVIGQLLTNAYLVSPAETTVTLQAQLLNRDTVQIRVQDSGGGILPEEHDEVFARRYRTEHQLVHGLGDTGVGLSISKAIIEAHGGTMNFDSENGKGTTFIIRLPIKQTPEAQK